MRSQAVLLASLLLSAGCASPAAEIALVADGQQSARSGMRAVLLYPERPAPEPAACTAYRAGETYAVDECRVIRPGDLRWRPSLDGQPWALWARWAGFQGEDAAGAGLPWEPVAVRALDADGERVASWDGRFREGAWADPP